MKHCSYTTTTTTTSAHTHLTLPWKLVSIWSLGQGRVQRHPGTKPDSLRLGWLSSHPKSSLTHPRDRASLSEGALEIVSPNSKPGEATRAGEKAQTVKCLSHKCEALSVMSYDPHKSHVWGGKDCGETAPAAFHQDPASIPRTHRATYNYNSSSQGSNTLF